MLRAFLTAVCILVLSITANAYGEERISENMNQNISNEKLHEIIPFNIDLMEAETKGLATGGKLSDEYCELYGYYAKCFWKFIEEKTDLSSFDKALAENEMRFVPVAGDDQNVYQGFFSFGCQFIYLRNHFCIERLSVSQLEKLNEMMKSDGTKDEELIRFVQETYQTVITLDPDAEPGVNYIFDLSTGNSAPNFSFLLGLSTDLEIGADGKMVSPAHEKEKQAYLQVLSTRLAKEIEEAIGFPAVVVLD